MVKTVLINKWSVDTIKSTENLNFPVIWLDYYLGQTLKVPKCPMILSVQQGKNVYLCPL